MAGLYIHIPFCRQACIYCNFYFKTGTGQMEQMTESICKELEMRKGEADESIETLYFGGGTPSYMPAESIASIIQAVRHNYSADGIIELTLEANPDDISTEKLKQWKNMGVNRLSIGVQSFFEEDLKWMNRAHTAAEAEQCITLALAENFEVSVDLIFGLPGSTEAKWASNLAKANALGVQHLSCYGLTLEENTGWKKLIERKKYVGPDETLTASQFEYTMDYLVKEGWEHYEISNYCKPGYMAKHNTSYWQQKKYLGFGPAAHSFTGTERQWNIADNMAYIQSVAEHKRPFEKEVLTQVNQVNEYLMTGLRTIWGISIEELIVRGFYNDEFSGKLKQYLAKGWINEKDDSITLTNEGKVYADAIASDLFF